MSALGDVAVGVVARAVVTEMYPTHDRDDSCDDWQADNATGVAHAALASLDSPEVVQGIAEVLRAHWPIRVERGDRWRQVCACGDEPYDLAAHQAQALVAALGGRADQ